MRKPIVCIALMSLLGCTTLRPLPVAEQELAYQLAAGDRAVIYEKSGRALDLRVERISQGRIEGTFNDPSGRPVSVALSEIEEIRVEKFDGVKTTAAVAGSVAAATVIFGAMATAALLSGFQ